MAREDYRSRSQLARLHAGERLHEVARQIVASWKRGERAASADLKEVSELQDLMYPNWKVSPPTC